MPVVALQRSNFSVSLLQKIQYRQWEELIHALEHGASPHVLVLQNMTVFEAFLRHVAKPSLFKTQEGFEEEVWHQKVFHALVSAWKFHDSSQLTPLSLATMMGRPDFVQHLVDVGHDPNEVGASHQPATILANPYWPRFPDDLATQRAEVGSGWAEDIRPGQHACFRILIQSGLDFDACTWHGYNALALACASKNAPFVLDLLHAGANPEGCGDHEALSPLEIAIQTHAEMPTQALLRQGANPLRTWTQAPYTGLPLATAACAEGLVSAVYAMLHYLKGLEHPALQAGWWLALSAGNSPVVGWFIDKGQDVFLRDDQGATALHHAVRGGSMRSIERLCGLGLDWSDTDHAGMSCRALFYSLHPQLAHNIFKHKVGEPGNVIAWRGPKAQSV